MFIEPLSIFALLIFNPSILIYVSLFVESSGIGVSIIPSILLTTIFSMRIANFNPTEVSMLASGLGRKL